VVLFLCSQVVGDLDEIKSHAKGFDNEQLSDQ
jgi:hypothetical protein